MKRLSLFVASLCFVSAYSYAQQGEWAKPGTVWKYDLTKKMSGQDSIGGDGLSFVSSAGNETFLPAPPSGTAMVSTTKGTPSFIRKSGSAAGVKIRGGNENGAPAKFSVFGITEAGPVAAISFTITPDHQAKSTNWYFVLGKDGSIFKSPAGVVPFRPGASLNASFFASFRLQSNESFGEKVLDKYRFQHRVQPELEDEVTWKNESINLFTKGKKHRVEIYANNSLAEQTYTLGGTAYKLPKRAYHLWVNGKKVGDDFPASAMRRNQPIDSFVFMSRDAVSGSDTSTLEISDIQVKYGSK